LTANFIASLKSSVFTKLTTKAPAKTSPAAVVSTALTFKESK